MKINGLPVEDATKKLVIVVKPQDIKGSNSKDPASCAAARACKRQLHNKEVRVHLSRIYVKFPRKWVRYETPLKLRDEIVAFDRGGKFLPGTYIAPKIRPTLSLGRRYVARKTKKQFPNRGKRLHRIQVAGVRSYGANR